MHTPARVCTQPGAFLYCARTGCLRVHTQTGWHAFIRLITVRTDEESACRVSGPFPKAAAGIGMLGFYLVDSAKLPAPVVILLGGALGVAAAALHLP